MTPLSDRDEIMGTSKLSKKFQITIPKRVREQYNLKEADLLMFIGNSDSLTLKKAKLIYDL